MVRVDEYARALEKAKTGGATASCQPQGKPSGEEMRAYNRSTNWQHTLAEHVLYQRPYLANSAMLRHLPLDSHDLDEPEQLYVFPCFLRPGKQTYAVISAPNLANSEHEVEIPRDPAKYFFHRDIVDNRDEDIPAFFKKLQSVQKERLFDHAKSVFREWRPDNEAMLAKCLEHDFTHWKVANFCKDPDEAEKVKRVISKHFPALKKVFHYLIGKSQYPGIGWQDYSGWAIAVKVPDEKCVQSKIDMAFTAANVQIQKIEGNDNNESSLCRFQFLEVVVRLGKAKYLDSGVEKTYAAAVEKLILDQIIGQDVTEEWQGFRDKELWNMTIHDMLEPNIPGLRKVYETHYAPRKRFMNMDDVVDLMVRQTGLLQMEKDAIYCAGMSKMTYPQETNHQDAYYNSLKFVEFLELLGRVAHLKYSGPGCAGMALAQKLEPVLDAVLGTQGLNRIEPQVTQVDESESDRDY